MISGQHGYLGYDMAIGYHRILGYLWEKGWLMISGQYGYLVYKIISGQ